ncbi:phosphate signaling complex protein PhoU [Clostridiaceae bacterium M8S5]|nr:phosphate signaling complex protein PhoU [Clostridiaceae bacterium M8S5]
MREYFDNQIEEIRNKVMKMGNMVEDIITLTMSALLDKDGRVINYIVKLDNEVDELELEIEKNCLSVIALQQPKAKDLRYISTALKIITDLERIGDLGVNIAKVIREIGEDEFIKPLVDIPKMGGLAVSMLNDSLNSYINEDIDLAINTALKDDEMDKLYKGIYIELLDMISVNSSVIKQSTQLLFIGRYLERIGDHVTNICERTVFMINGKRVKY